jgi:hypothetical protein
MPWPIPRPRSCPFRSTSRFYLSAGVVRPGCCKNAMVFSGRLLIFQRLGLDVTIRELLRKIITLQIRKTEREGTEFQKAVVHILRIVGTQWRRYTSRRSWCKNGGNTDIQIFYIPIASVTELWRFCNEVVLSANHTTARQHNYSVFISWNYIPEREKPL